MRRWRRNGSRRRRRDTRKEGSREGQTYKIDIGKAAWKEQEGQGRDEGDRIGNDQDIHVKKRTKNEKITD